jgi:hypothetical protein
LRKIENTVEISRDWRGRENGEFLFHGYRVLSEMIKNFEMIV